MTNDNRQGAWEEEFSARQRLFKDVKFILGTRHVVKTAEGQQEEQCGPNCSFRLNSISCPFFTPTVPCLVGCEVQQRVGTPGDGMGYEELAIRVVAQAGNYLIGEEVVINLNNPKSEYIRILSDKRGQPIGSAVGRKDVSLFSDLQQGVFISQVEIKDVKQNDQLDASE